MASAAELLEETNAAISACLKSQAYSVAERSQQRAQLSQLQAFRTELLKEINDSGNCGRMATVGQIDRAT